MLMRMRLCLSDDDDDEDATNRLSTDPFELHFNLPSDDYLAKEEKLVLKDNEKWRTVDKQTYSDLAISSLVQLPPGEPLNPPLLKSSKLSEYTIKKRVLDSYEQAYGTDLSDLESTLINPILNYRDVNFQYKSFKTNFTGDYILCMH